MVRTSIIQAVAPMHADEVEIDQSLVRQLLAHSSRSGGTYPFSWSCRAAQITRSSDSATGCRFECHESA